MFNWLALHPSGSTDTTNWYLCDKLVCYCYALQQVSNNFYFTFTVPSDTQRNGSKIRNVVPATEAEALRVIECIDVVRNKRDNVRWDWMNARKHNSLITIKVCRGDGWNHFTLIVSLEFEPSVLWIWINRVCEYWRLDVIAKMKKEINCIA